MRDTGINALVYSLTQRPNLDNNNSTAIVFSFQNLPFFNYAISLDHSSVANEVAGFEIDHDMVNTK